MTIKQRITTKPGYKILFVIGLIVIGQTLDYRWQMQELAASMACLSSHTPQDKYREYFRRNRNPSPQKMAEAVLASGSPRLMAAIAVKGEKNTPYTVR